jgi:hypothetical protein
MKKSIKVTFPIVLALLLIIAINCSNGATAPRNQYDQVDKVGRPAISIVLIHTGGDPTLETETDPIKNEYNKTAPHNDLTKWTNTLTTSLTTFRSLYGGATNDISTFNNILLPDVLTMDFSRSSGTSGYLGDLLTTSGDGGRGLTDDVIDASLKNIIFPSTDSGVQAGFQTDYIDANDKAFSNTFPYLADPH